VEPVIRSIPAATLLRTAAIWNRAGRAPGPVC